jgi:hypothetical protein
MHQVISSNNELLQSRLMMLRDADKKDGLSLAKLTKEIIKLADTYKVPELKFDEQASKQCYNYQTWIMKLRLILAMFPQTASVLPGDSIIPFQDLHSNKNRALYLLLSVRTDSYFQRAIKQHEPFGDKALELIQKQCAHISHKDKSYFHETFVNLRIRENESASSFLKKFTYAKTTAEAASNTYTDDQLVDYVLSVIHPSKQDVYNTALQLYRLECLHRKKFTLQYIKQNLFQIDEESVETNGDFAQNTPWQRQDDIPNRLTVVLVDHTMVAEAEDVVDGFPIITHLVLLLLLLRIPIPQLCAINVVSPAILRLSALLILAPPLGHNSNVPVWPHLHAPHSPQHVDMLPLPRRGIPALVLPMARVMSLYVWHVASTWTLQ